LGKISYNLFTIRAGGYKEFVMGEGEMTKLHNTLHVSMFGDFTLSYAGEEIILGRNTVTKFTQLLQIVWLHGDKGVSKQELIRDLYHSGELANPSNSLNNLIFQMRKQMVLAGLPKEEYVIKRGKIYIPDERVPLDIDVVNFKRFCAEAEKETVPAVKNELYSRALELYRGELLQEYRTRTWVVSENVALRKMFEQAIRYVGSYAKEQEDYDAMFRAYERAAKIYPDNDWQAYQIEALIGKEEYCEAYKLYDRTVNFYSDKMGLPPSPRMLSNYRKMSRELTFPMQRLDEIKPVLQEEALTKGGYYCSYPGFIDVYRAFDRNMERTGFSIFLLLCTLVDYEGKPFRNKDKLQVVSEELQTVIGTSIRRGDIYTKYNASQYLVLLVGSNKEGCEVVAERIRNNFKDRVGNKAGVRYHSVSLSDLSHMPLG
jgi:DNA-binding SARP family transcriptional activator